MKHLITTIILMLGLTVQTMAQQEIIRPSEISKAAFFDVSPPLRDIPQIAPGPIDRSWKNGVVKNKLDMAEFSSVPLPEVSFGDYSNAQTRQGSRTSQLLQSFNGVGNVNNVLPPDTQGDVGPNHYMQMVNLSLAIWNKSGAMVYGPVASKTLWNGFPGPWSNSNDGDPVVLYDEQADRWIASQFALPNYPYGPFYELIAVSQTGDPTGAWYRYAYTFTNMPDYPKLGVWHDGYYLSVNSFSSGSGNWAGTGVAALERDKMLAGDPTASMIFFTTSSGSDPSSFLPADCDGTPAPAGSPALFAYMRDASPDRLVLYSLTADWTTPANSAFTQLVTLATEPFSSNISYIPQQGSSVTLQSLSSRLMYRLQYRNFGSYQAMVTNHTINVSGHAGVRWYELRNYGSGWEIYQQSTYSPDATSRWMGSIAMNSYGDIALGYSASSASLYPSIRFTGRRANDPLGEMTFAEQDIVAGGGAQTSNYQRWGDYSMMSVDPAADSVFWYTQQYYTSTSNQSWKTRIGSFTFGVPMVLSLSADIDTICAGTSVQLESQVNGAAGAIEYLWTSVPGSFTSNLPNPMVTPDVTTEYTLTATSGSNSVTSSIIITVNPVPSVSASDDMTVCEGTVVRVIANATGYDSFTWTSLGDGTFLDPMILRADYIPGTQDILTGHVTLIASAVSTHGCPSAADSLELTIFAAPLANAGLPLVTCGNAPVQLNGIATGYSAVLWSSAGDGSFVDPAIANAVYTPGTADVLAGSVDLTFTADGNAPCEDVSSSTNVTIYSSASVAGGDDQVVCADQNIELTASAENYESVLWATAGDGQFSDATSLTTTYVPGPGDLTAGQAEITISAQGNSLCAPVTDQLVITINGLPTASAGNDTTICKTSSIFVQGTAENASAYLWTSSGNGEFLDAAALETTYLPGTQDTVSGSVVLTLNVTSAFGCGEVEAQKTLEFAACLGIESIGKASVKILPNPTSGKFSAEVTGMSDNLKFRMVVADAKGNVVIDEQHSSIGGIFKTTLDLSSHSKGIYLLKLSAGSEMTTVKIILQ